MGGKAEKDVLEEDRGWEEWTPIRELEPKRGRHLDGLLHNCRQSEPRRAAMGQVET